MGNFLPQSETIFNFSVVLLVVMVAVLAIFTGFLLAKLRRLKKYITKEKVDIAVTIISIVIIAMCIGAIIAYLFCMNAVMR